MAEKIHQSSNSKYQIRIDGVPVRYHHAVDKNALEEWVNLCDKNPECYIDIVRIDTQIVISQYEYHQMKRHFIPSTKGDNS